MTTKDWKNRRNTNPGGTTPTTLRIATEKRNRVAKLADKNNTTITAIVDYALDLFFAEIDAPKAAKSTELF